MSTKKKPDILNDSPRPLVCRLPLAPGEAPTKPTSLNEITWRIFRIMAEFVEGFQFLSESSREVTFFGSARTKKTDRWYKEGVKLGKLLAESGFTVITGGGPGIMEALNKGAYDAGGVSIGLNIQLPNEQRINPYVTKGRAFHYFFTRKVMLAASAQVYVYFPGGFGTLDELFEIVMLIETGKMQPTPVVCVGKEFWSGLFAWMEEMPVKKYKTLTAKELKLIQVVDSAEEALAIICASDDRTFF